MAPKIGLVPYHVVTLDALARLLPWRTVSRYTTRCLAAAAFLVLEEWHFQATVFNLWPVTLRFETKQHKNVSISKERICTSSSKKRRKRKK
uniref:Uncharacterized protein n=1 Tax=Oryza punctata TaxID=4537 RepID=A0A0E0K3Z0_ORYPU